MENREFTPESYCARPSCTLLRTLSPSRPLLIPPFTDPSFPTDSYKCSTGFSGVVYGLVAVEVCLSYRRRRAWEVAGLAKHAFLFKTLFLVWVELRADASASKDKADDIHHAGHLAGMLTGGLFALAIFHSLHFQSFARIICRRWALPFPLLDATCSTAKEEGVVGITKVKGA